ncbi:hypothetical protein G9A89_020462 [Geosiphon pyriformis]|nr:hypothetical protein G9A89_020462 [Geosiphon pyriformis]
MVALTDFGLTDEYHVHNGLDQGERQESICGYRLISHFVSKTSQMESQAELTSFLATGAFVDDTIWVSSSQTATQHILNVVSDFFHLNDISINNDKTVVIFFNCQVAASYLTISGMPISITKRGLLKPNLVKVHSDVRFFVNCILKKVISDKQFAYLVSSVLFSIISYRTQFSFIPFSVCNKWNALIRKGLKSKSGLPLDFSNDTLYHPSLYNLKTFEQIQAKSKSASVIAFANSTPMAQSPSGLISVCFLGGVASPSSRSLYEGVCGSSDIYQSLGFGVVCNNLLNVGAAHLSVYTDRSLSNLGSVDMLAGPMVFFKNIDSGLDVGVSGLVFSTLAELQAIALALECVSSFHLVDLFSDSQVAIDAYRLEFLSAGPDFRNCCWIECCYIANVICYKNLDVNWIKVKSHSGVSGNKRANALAKNAALSAWYLPHLVSERFLKAGVDIVSGNLRHFVCDVGSGSQIVPGCLRADIDWLRSFLMWHLDSYMATGFTSIWTAGFCTYFMKAFHHHLPVAVRKHLYNRGYPSVVCLFCSKVEVSDHVFSYFSDADNCASLLDTYATTWEVHSDVTVSTVLCKDFVFSNWYHKFVSVYKDPKVAVVNVVNFVCEFCFAFRDNIWLVHVKHQAIMEKNKLILHNGFILVTVSGFSTWLSAGIIRLLDVADVLDISFGYHKCCLFYAGVSNMASVHISA